MMIFCSLQQAKLTLCSGRARHGLCFLEISVSISRTVLRGSYIISTRIFHVSLLKMQEPILILSIHSQNSPSIPICCLALRYRNNEALDSVLQTTGSHHQLDNDISSVTPVFSLVTRVSSVSHFACTAAFLTV